MDVPIYNPHYRTYEFAMLNYKRYRNTSSGFIKKARNYILKRDNNKCNYCGSTENLQIDHITSVYRGYKEQISLDVINHVDNLQVLCLTCNASKSPDLKER